VGVAQISNTVLRGYTTAIGGEMTATRAGQFVAAGSHMRNMAVFSNMNNIDADLVAAGADVQIASTSDPQMRGTAGYQQRDYALLPSSPAEALGIGFTLADLGLS
jgi:hypothetical protein